MHRYPKCLGIFFTALACALILCCTTDKALACMNIELTDSINGNSASLCLGEKAFRIEEKREITIVNLSQKKVYSINPKSGAYTVRSFESIESSQRLLEKHNRQNPAFSDKDASVTVGSIQKIDLHNKPYFAAFISYSVGKGLRKKRSGAYEPSLGNIAKNILRNGAARDILSKYFAHDEIETLKHGFIPFKSSRFYDFKNLTVIGSDQGLFELPKNFREKSQGEYFKDMAVTMIGGERGK